VAIKTVLQQQQLEPDKTYSRLQKLQLALLSIERKHLNELDTDEIIKTLSNSEARNHFIM